LYSSAFALLFTQPFTNTGLKELFMAYGPNLEEYRDPELYDLENPDFEPEGPFYLAYARELGGSVLELGCGTGRITIPLAKAGVEITGLDVVSGMLAQARAKAGGLPVEWIEADVRSFHLGRRFKLIFENGCVFMHMLTRSDQQAFLARVREHLAPGGRFIVSLLFPHPDLLVTDREEKDWFTYTDLQGRTVRVSGTDEYDELRQVKTETAIRRIIEPDGAETVRVAPLSLRYTFPQEMEALLEQAGFEVLERFGGPDRSPVSKESQHLVYVCR
jgi:SAM-dependent methyltransferase